MPAYDPTRDGRYRNTGPHQSPSLVLDPQVAPLMKEAFERISSGAELPHQVLERLRAAGL